MKLAIIGGSDAGISAGLRAVEVGTDAEATLFVADAYPNFSICGIPYHVSGQVPDWRSLAHRTRDDLERAGLRLRLEETVTAIDPSARTVTSRSAGGDPAVTPYDRLVIGTGAVPVRPPIDGLDDLGTSDGVHVLHTMGDTFALTERLEQRLERGPARSAVIVGAGYIGMEMAEALVERGLRVTVIEQLDQVLPNTLDAELAVPVGAVLTGQGVELVTGVAVKGVERYRDGLRLVTSNGRTHATDLLLVVTGVRPDTALAADAGITLGVRGAIAVDVNMRTNLPGVYAAGDCVHTHHRLLAEPTYMPLGSTAHKQGRVAGENAAGGERAFAGVLGTQAVKVFDRVVAATGLRDGQARQAGYEPFTVETVADDHKAYYPGASPIRIRLTGDLDSGRLLGAQLVGMVGAEIAKRIDVLATGIHAGITVEDINDLDLSYTPPLGSPWDALQHSAQAWTRAAADRR
ncbi:FAD-dependent oxidoreductase [Actinomadura sp. SCN-SB]|uniref:FAD-dependent oxidoreductase n=1 Tax=Actinomadura sp. SCN-SB TaxID=3373092 RepID=UPI00374FFA6B